MLDLFQKVILISYRQQYCFKSFHYQLPLIQFRKIKNFLFPLDTPLSMENFLQGQLDLLNLEVMYRSLVVFPRCYSAWGL